MRMRLIGGDSMEVHSFKNHSLNPVDTALFVNYWLMIQL